MGGRIHCWPVVVPAVLVWMVVSVANVIAAASAVFGIVPLLSRTPMSMGLPLYVMSTSSSLNTVSPVLVNTDIVPSLEVVPTLINDVGKSWKVSACLALADSLWNGSWVMC